MDMRFCSRADKGSTLNESYSFYYMNNPLSISILPSKRKIKEHIHIIIARLNFLIFHFFLNKFLKSFTFYMRLKSQ